MQRLLKALMGTVILTVGSLNAVAGIENDAKAYGNQLAITFNDAMDNGFKATGKSMVPMIVKEAIKKGYRSKSEQQLFVNIASAEAIREMKILNGIQP